MPASRAKIKRQSKPRTPGAGKVSGGHCQRTGFVRYDSLNAARKAAGEDEEAVSCAYCRGAHIKTAKRRKQSQRNNQR